MRIHLKNKNGKDDSNTIQNAKSRNKKSAAKHTKNEKNGLSNNENNSFPTSNHFLQDQFLNSTIPASKLFKAFWISTQKFPSHY